MATYVQADRLLQVTTPLGKDQLLLIGLNGTESISSLYRFQLELIAENQTETPFDKLLGKKITASYTPCWRGVHPYLEAICRMRHSLTSEDSLPLSKKAIRGLHRTLSSIDLK